MPVTNLLCAVLGAIVLCAVAGGCVYQGKPKPRPAIDEPVDAFEAVGEPAPAEGAVGSDRANLSSDIQRLQNARAVFKHEQQRRQAEALRDQAQCRVAPDSRKVRIHDGSGDPDAVYCQRAPRTQK